MAFKMKAGAGGPMKKNFPSAFKADIPEVTVEALEPRVPQLRKGYIEKDGKYYREQREKETGGKKINPYTQPVSAKEALVAVRKSQARTTGEG